MGSRVASRHLLLIGEMLVLIADCRHKEPQWPRTPATLSVSLVQSWLVDFNLNPIWFLFRLTFK